MKLGLNLKTKLWKIKVNPYILRFSKDITEELIIRFENKQKIRKAYK